MEEGFQCAISAKKGHRGTIDGYNTKQYPENKISQGMYLNRRFENLDSGEILEICRTIVVLS